MNTWAIIIARYGIEFAVELAQLLKATPDPTPEMFQALKMKYAVKTEEDYVAEAIANTQKPA